MLRALLLLAACRTDPVELWLACTDSACRSEALLPAFDADKQRLGRALGDLDPVEAEVLIRTLSKSRPTALRDACAAMPAANSAALTCQKLLERPHLAVAADTRRVEVELSRAAPGPSSAHLPPPGPRALPWSGASAAELAGVLGSCPPEGECVTATALRLAREGAVREAGMACQAGHPQEETEREECLFQAAEATARARGVSGFSDALGLCAAAEHFVTPCLEHIVGLAAPPAPPADQPGAAEIAAIIDAVHAVRSAVGPDLADLYSDLLWATWVETAFRQSVTVTGHLLGLLPPPALPHVRMSAAARLLSLEGLGARTADQQLALLAERLDVSGPPVEASPTLRPVDLLKPRDLWPTDASPEERAIPAAYCMGFARRAIAPEPRADLQIVVLEAAARLDPPPPPAFFEAWARPEQPPVVRWTAMRLSRAVTAPERAPKPPRSAP